MVGGSRALLGGIPAVIWFYGSYLALVFAPLSVTLATMLVVSLGLAIPATVTKVSHEGLHQSLTTKRWLNWVVAHVASPLGASWHWWCAKHNNAHHGFTNVGGFDHDLEQPGLRLSPRQQWHPWHRIQHVYVWVLYPFGTLAMVLVGDAEYIVRGSLKGRQVERPSVTRTLALLAEKLGPAGLSDRARAHPTACVRSRGRVVRRVPRCGSFLLGDDRDRPLRRVHRVPAA